MDTWRNDAGLPAVRIQSHGWVMTAEPDLPGLLDQVSSHTDVTYGDLALIGAALLTTVTSVGLHGW